MARGKICYKILIWNCESLHSKKQEVDILIAKHNPAVVCLQDTRLTSDRESFYKFPGYTPYFKSIGSNASGVAILVKNTIPQSQISISTNLQALAVRVTMKGKTYVITSLYIPPSSIPTISDLDSFISQLDSRAYLLNGDLNAHSPLWGANKTCPRGDLVEEVLNKYDVIPINISDKTFWSRAHNTYSLVDLSIAHASVFLDFTYEVLPDLHTSDHYPIILDLAGDSDEGEKIPHWNFKKADQLKLWPDFIKKCRETLTPAMFDEDEDKMKTFTQNLIDIATDIIPQTSRFNKQKSKVWFDDECKAAKRERNKAERFNKLHPDLPSSIRVKKMQAFTRRLFRKKKRQSFRNYVSSLGDKVKAKKVWNFVSKMTGKKIPSHLHHLKDEHGNLITDKEEVANLFGKTYENIHSSQNYSDAFKPTKSAEEQTPIDFSTNKQFHYNRKFKLRDLKRSIKRAKNTAAGPDQVHYELLKHLPDECLKVLLDLINEYWESNTFPPSWRLALVLPIPKPDKDRFLPTSYRPIALTSCICKTMERMVNERLIHHLEKKKILTKFQCGFRNDKSTTDQLVRFETYIRDAFIDQQHVVAVFFDLHKAYDTTWKYGILRDLYDMGFRGNLPNFIQNFLSDRIFSVVFGSLTSDSYSQEEGVPQGAILSTTLFNIKLNGIAKEICPGVECSLYVDDFVIYFRARTSTCLTRKLQLCINSILEWTTKNGFTIADDKTKAMHFCRKRCCDDPELFLGDKPISFTNKKKFLGLIWDPKLSFKEHILYLREKCQSSLNLLKVLSSSDWGASRKCLLKLYRALIRSKLDYGCIVYRNASDSLLKKLDPVHNLGLRLSLGAFKSSPVESLYVEANELPLKERRQEQVMKYGLRIKGNPSNPAYNSVFDLDFLDKYNAPVRSARRGNSRPRRRARSLAVDLAELLEEAQIDVSKILPNVVSTYPPCYSRDVDVSFYLLAYDKSSTTDEIYNAAFNELLQQQYSDYLAFYTDGSKKDEIASWGMYSEYGVASARICDDSSIFTAEVEGINRALRHIEINPRITGKFVIFSDSKSVLESIQNPHNSKNILIKKLNDKLQRIIQTSRKTVKFCWVPSHRNIAGNERADTAAGRARNRVEQRQYRIPYTDFYPKVKQFIRNKWQRRWTQCDAVRPNKLYAIQPELGEFEIFGLTRKEEAVIHRIRIGHTRLTHAYLMEQRGPIKIPPTCHFCNNPNEMLTVRHIMINCPHFKYTRRRFYYSPSMRHLFESVSLTNIVGFLRTAGIFKDI